MEGTLLYPDQGLPAVLQEGVERRSNLGNGPVPLQSEADRRRTSRLGEQENLQHRLDGTSRPRWQDLPEGISRTRGLVRATRRVHARVQGEEESHEDILSGEEPEG